MLYRWFTPDTDSTALLCSPKGADAISVSVVLCVFSNAILSYDYRQYLQLFSDPGTGMNIFEQRVSY